MKRSQLARKSPLRARAPMRRRRAKPPVETVEQRNARLIWKTPRAGFCQCGCDRFSLHLERHHVLTVSRLKQEGRTDVLWQLENSMLLHPHCHERHTGHARKIRIEHVPAVALQFAVDVLGEGAAAAYFSAHYDCAVTR